LIGVIYATAGMYILGRLGVDITPLLASAGVAGLAIAFGAQTLIRDYLSGFFILIENQFTIGDVIDVGGVSGVVESITLRVTVLRDAEGVVHYVPNGTLARVSNKTQGWSRSVVDVGVGYGENLDRVTEVLKRTLAQLQAELPWKFLILEEPTVLGVEQLSDSSINLRVSVTCRPGKQWDLSRELRKRIKRAFDDAGIQIPYPQRVVHHVHEEGGPLGHPARLDAGERGAGR
jgi:small conductance mechanosensitive channel